MMFLFLVSTFAILTCAVLIFFLKFSSDKQHHQQEQRTSFSNNAVTILGRLHTDSKLQRKTEETESLKEEVRRLREGIEQKDKELQDIHKYLSGIMDNFPHDRNSMEEICHDLQTSNAINLQTEDVKQDQSDIDIYYSRQSV